MIKQTFFVTKYALTKGIEAVQGERPETDRMIAVRASHGQFAVYFWHGKDAFDTFTEAQKVAEAMRLHKIKSLKINLRTLENMRFETVRK